MIDMIEKALRKAGWALDRPRNNLGRYRVVYTKNGRQLALVAGNNGAGAEIGRASCRERV